MYKVGIIGDRDSVLAFKAVGIEVRDAADHPYALAALREFTTQNYAIIYVTEQIYKLLETEIDKFKDSAVPAIITLPNNQGSMGLGMSDIKKSVERAIGVDIFDDAN